MCYPCLRTFSRSDGEGVYPAGNSDEPWGDCGRIQMAQRSSYSSRTNSFSREILVFSSRDKLVGRPWGNLIAKSDFLIRIVLSRLSKVDPYWTLNSTPGTTLHTGQVYSLTPTTSDIYTAWGTSYASGCLVSQNYYVELDAPSALTVTANPATLCANGQTQLDVIPRSP